MLKEHDRAFVYVGLVAERWRGMVRVAVTEGGRHQTVAARWQTIFLFLHQKIKGNTNGDEVTNENGRFVIYFLLYFLNSYVYKKGAVRLQKILGASKYIHCHS